MRNWIIVGLFCLAIGALSLKTQSTVAQNSSPSFSQRLEKLEKLEENRIRHVTFPRGNDPLMYAKQIGNIPGKTNLATLPDSVKLPANGTYLVIFNAGIIWNSKTNVAPNALRLAWLTGTYTDPTTGAPKTVRGSGSYVVPTVKPNGTVASTITILAQFTEVPADTDVVAMFQRNQDSNAFSLVVRDPTFTIIKIR